MGAKPPAVAQESKPCGTAVLAAATIDGDGGIFSHLLVSFLLICRLFALSFSADLLPVMASLFGNGDSASTTTISSPEELKRSVNQSVAQKKLKDLVEVRGLMLSCFLARRRTRISLLAFPGNLSD